MANDNLAMSAAPLDQASPIVLAKSASSSSVLSSVSLASGAQIRQHQNLIADRSAGANLGEQQRAKLDNSTGGGQTNAALLAGARLSELSETETDDADKTTSAKIRDAASTEPKISDPGDDAPDLQSSLTAVARDPQIQTPKPQITELKRLLRHTNSLNEIPEFGIETENEEELAQLIDQIDVWGLNIFEVHTFSQQHSLTAVMYKIFKVSNRSNYLMMRISLHCSLMINRISKNLGAQPYANFRHLTEETGQLPANIRSALPECSISQ